MTVLDALERGIASRAELADLGCYRLFDGYGEGADGLAVDRYEATAVIRHQGDVPELRAIAERVAAVDGIERVLHQRRGIGHAPRPVIGDVPHERLACREDGLALWLDFTRAGNPGLYLDTRPARRWLRGGAADGRRVLNLFAFTGSLGIAAALGGARGVVHVDNHGPTLAWARANTELNDLRADDRDFARLNVDQHLRKAKTRRQRFGGIILDPSPAAGNLQTLAPLAAQMLEPGGWLLCFFQHDTTHHDALEDALARATGLEPSWRATSGEDFRDPGAGARTRMTAFTRAAE